MNIVNVRSLIMPTPARTYSVTRITGQIIAILGAEVVGNTIGMILDESEGQVYSEIFIAAVYVGVPYARPQHETWYYINTLLLDKNYFAIFQIEDHDSYRRKLDTTRFDSYSTVIKPPTGEPERLWGVTGTYPLDYFPKDGKEPFGDM